MEIKKKIEEYINTNEVCLFMKGTPESPQCGFSMAVSNVLKHLKIDFKGINVLDDENLRQGIKEFSDSLIQQIDTMSSIATAFSDFAEMPEPKKELLNVVEVVELAIDIFNKNHTLV